MTDLEIEGLVDDLMYARKMGDFGSATDIEADLNQAGVRISEGRYGLRWHRQNAEVE